MPGWEVYPQALLGALWEAIDELSDRVQVAGIGELRGRP